MKGFKNSSVNYKSLMDINSENLDNLDNLDNLINLTKDIDSSYKEESVTVKCNDDANDSELSDDDVFDLIHNKKSTSEIETTKENKENFVYGIDLGTTNSCISLWRNNNIEIIPDEYGNKTIPSMVAYSEVSQYVGYDAKNQKDINTENVFYEVKRLIGRKFSDEAVQKESDMLSYKIVQDDKEGICLQSTVMNNKTFTPEEISANILMKLKSMAKRYMNTTDIKNVVITIPANFNDGQRQATKDAAEIAGLNPLMLINEPTAAALAYGMANRTKILKKSKQADADNAVHDDESSDNSSESSSDSDSMNSEDFLTIMVYDFGGGTLDVSLLVVYDGIFEVKASSGNTHFGGSDFDDRIMTFCLDKFKKRHGYSKLSLPCLSLQKLRKECENAKQILSTNAKTRIAVRNFYDGKDLFVPLTRKYFETICADLFMACLHPVDDILDCTDTEVEEIDEIILVGGMTKVPYIKQLIKNKFGKDGNFTINPNEAISVGAAVQGYLITHKEDPFSDNIGLIDVTSLSLGVETIGEVMDTLVPRKTILPCEKSKIFTTDTDEVESVLIKIYEGERAMTCNNFFVGEFELGGIPPAPRGYPEIEVKFSIDTNGIISVTAKDLRTDECNSITVSGNKGRLTREEISELVDSCRQQEYLDDIERMKKLNHYEISDLCQTILDNIASEEFKLKTLDKEKITEDINNTVKWLNDKKYNDRELEDLEEKVDQMKEKYGTLILRGNIKDDKFEDNNEDSKDIQKTTLYGDDEEDDKEMNMVFEKLEEEELGTAGMTDVDKDEIKDLRNNLMTLCESCFDVIKSDDLQISKDHKNELCEFINDSLLWMYAHEKPTKTEYKIKIDEIDDACNKIMKEYDDSNKLFKTNEIVKSNENVISELENLCITIKIMIDQKSLPIDIMKDSGFKDSRMLLRVVDKELEWIFDNVHNKPNLAKEDQIEMSELENTCTEKLSKLNELCETIYTRNVHKIFIDKNIVVTEYDEESKPNETIFDENIDMVGTCGTSIMDIIKKRQEEEMNRMIEEMNENEDEDEDEDENKDEDSTLNTNNDKDNEINTNCEVLN